MKTSHITCISKILKDLKKYTKNKNKIYFCKSCLHCFSSKNVLTEHKKVSLSINEKGTTEFINYFKQIPVPFKVYAVSECNLESVESYKGYQRFFLKKILDHILCSFAYRLGCVDDRFSKPIFVFRGKNAAINLLK